MYETLKLLLHHVTEYSILAFEYVGVLTIIYGGIKGLYCFLAKKGTAKLMLGGMLDMGLSFLLVAEILHTVVGGNIMDVAAVAALFGLRAAMTVLLHWEVTHAKHEHKE